MKKDLFFNKKIKIYFSLNLIILFLIISVCILILKIENDRFNLNVKLLFQDEVGASDFTYLGRRLGDFERQGELTCINVKMISDSVIPMYQTEYKPQCQSSFNRIFSLKNKGNFKSLNNITYEVSYYFLVDKIFLLSYFIFSLILLFLVNLICYFLLKQQSRDLLLLNTKVEALDSLNKIASHFIHDVKSPLSLFNVLSKHDAVNVDLQDTIKMAYGRITELIDKLNHDFSHDRNTFRTNVDSFLLSPVIKQIVSEKKIAHNLEIQLNLIENILVVANKIELKRVLSNLIENAIEAVERNEHKEIKIQILEGNCLEISDNGKGIPKQILSSIGKRGFSYDKKNGTGLGLYHAYHNCKQWGAKLTLSSEENSGTKIIIKFNSL